MQDHRANTGGRGDSMGDRLGQTRLGSCLNTFAIVGELGVSCGGSGCCWQCARGDGTGRRRGERAVCEARRGELRSRSGFGS